jgi:SAM-dependent methyltransferase
MKLSSKKLAQWRYSMIKPYIHGEILELGCGDAIILDMFSSAIDYYCGVEWSVRHIDHVLGRFPDADIYQRNLDKDPLCLGREFDVVLMSALIEHIWNQRFLFEQVISHLRPEGKIVITTPTPFGNDIVHRLGAKLGVFAQSAVDDHMVIYNKVRFRNLANELGLKIEVYRTFQCFCNQLVVMGIRSKRKDEGASR